MWSLARGRRSAEEESEQLLHQRGGFPAEAVGELLQVLLCHLTDAGGERSKERERVRGTDPACLSPSLTSILGPQMLQSDGRPPRLLGALRKIRVSVLLFSSVPAAQWKGVPLQLI